MDEKEEKKETPSVVYAIPQAMPPDNSDEIDLRELWNTLMRRKFVVLITMVLVLLAALAYIYLAQPVYEAKALLSIGHYSYFDEDGLLQVQLLEEVNNLSAYVNFNHSATSSVLDEDAGYFTITANGQNKNEAEKSLMIAVNDVLSKHNQFYDSAVETSQTEINRLEKQIEYYSNDILPNMRSELESLQSLQLKRMADNVNSSTLSLEMDYLLNQIISGKISGIAELVDITVPTLNAEVMTLEKILNEPYLQKTTLVNGISSGNSPVKPNKKMILAVSLVAGLMLGVFLVFFLEFLRGSKKEDDSKS